MGDDLARDPALVNDAPAGHRPAGFDPARVTVHAAAVVVEDRKTGRLKLLTTMSALSSAEALGKAILTTQCWEDGEWRVVGNHEASLTVDCPCDSGSDRNGEDAPAAECVSIAERAEGIARTPSPIRTEA